MSKFLLLIVCDLLFDELFNIKSVFFSFYFQVSIIGFWSVIIMDFIYTDYN